jgi:hypothetical protein
VEIFNLDIRQKGTAMEDNGEYSASNDTHRVTVDVPRSMWARILRGLKLGETRRGFFLQAAETELSEREAAARRDGGDSDFLPPGFGK